MSDTARRASIIVNNYNYGRFLAEAIDSALGQTYPRVKVIVVDDGSTDESRAVIARYGDRVVPVLKANGGQASAFNAGLAASTGDAILFLDSDDVLLPTAIETALPLLDDPDVVKVHWSLFEIDEAGARTGRLMPAHALPDGDLREMAIAVGPTNCPSAPTTGNLWARRFLEQIFPVPEAEYRIGADTYLFELAPFFGRIRHVSTPQALYRLHANNNWARLSFEEKLRYELAFYARYADMIVRRCRQLGLDVDPRAWEARSWWHRVQVAIEELRDGVPNGHAFILIDDDTLGVAHLEDRPRRHFVERDGCYWGPPADDRQAIAHLLQSRADGADFLAIVWPAFWWLDHYAEFVRYLRGSYGCVLENERIILFDLRETAGKTRREPAAAR